MAIIGNLGEVRERHFKDDLLIVFDYLLQAVDKKSSVNRRIFDRPLGAFERVDLNEGVFALEQVFETKNRNNCFFESHLKYIDFQLILSGSECMEFININKMTVAEEYDSARDLIVYEDSSFASKIIMKENDISIFYPEDVHLGLGWVDSKKNIVHKTVVKLPIDF